MSKLTDPNNSKLTGLNVSKLTNPKSRVLNNSNVSKQTTSPKKSLRINSKEREPPEWKLQSTFVEMLQKSDTPDPYSYKQFEYENYEWDNIGKIVPKFLIHLEKYVKGISASVDEF